MKTMKQLGFDNTTKTMIESRAYTNEMIKELNKSQKECNERNEQYKNNKLPIGFKFNKRGFLYKILSYDKNLGMYECLNTNSGKYKQRTYYTYNEILQK